ncbi:AMP-binding protein [Zavarzinia compransoris]|uniref:3-methylmercaptopropionyl-CoA ligase n=1 Tax=Zavarzinia compransoris TaxID=1264899 RepID=A0A317E4V3_9PROT|nr:AMP-binding protein [Zavarzinia compransoris]PWR21681.1 AMP-dependent synthetase [Zavarzinia compransoris]TDP45535.1 long-chain acyl-CoA synthetase [Zavarzinia compransoris]
MVEPVMSSLAFDAARRFGDAVALTLPGQGSLTFHEIDQRAGRFAGGLAALGIGPGDRVVLHLPNGWEWIAAYHALARLGAVVVPANILLSPQEVGYAAADSGAKALILPAERRDAVPVPAGAIVIAPGGDAEFEALLASGYRAPVAVRPDDLFTIGYTSGTTGRPKGAMLSHRCVFSSMAATATIHVRHRGDTVLSALPLPHVYGNIVMNAAFQSGMRLVLLPRFDAGEVLRLIEIERVTLFEGVPTMYYQMLAHPDIAAAALGSLTRCTVGGQTMPTAKIEAVVSRFGCPLLELWGMTEVAGPAVTHSPYWPPRLGSIGLPVPGVEARIADLADPARDAGPGQAGELVVRGPLVTQGYWNNPAATAETIDPAGWLATGDIARMDEDGYIFIVDRKKDLIITAGYNVYPAELEQVIAMHPAVAMVAVAGVPDADKGEIAQAFVVRHSGAALDEAELLLHCRHHLAAYKIPRRIAFVSDLPKTSTGKILRRSLRDDARSQGAANH